MDDRQRNIDLGKHIASLVSINPDDDFAEWLGRETAKYVVLQNLAFEKAIKKDKHDA